MITGSRPGRGRDLHWLVQNTTTTMVDCCVKLKGKDTVYKLLSVCSIIGDKN